MRPSSHPTALPTSQPSKKVMLASYGGASGAVAGTAVGFLAGVVIIGVGIYYFVRTRQASKGTPRLITAQDDSHGLEEEDVDRL
jgi:uncharacterized protein HemX